MLVDEACEIVKMVEEFNAYKGEQVAKVIKKIAQLWPSDHQHVTFSFGREYYASSIYVHIPLLEVTN